jgi:DNA-directed RNA polymerase I subunit RPA49
MSLFIDSYSTDLEDFRTDLRIERPKAVIYFQELGCFVDSPNENEKIKMRNRKQDPRGRRVARLKIPLEFPKPRKALAKRGR